MRIIIIDDHLLFLQGITTLLEQRLSGVKIESFQHIKDAYSLIKKDPHFDLILSDIYMPKLNGMSIMELLSLDEVFIPVLLVSATEDFQLIKKYLDLNAAGFVHKSSEPDELIKAIENVIEQGTYLSQSVVKNINRIQVINLSKRQSEVLEQLANGLTNKQIGDSLGIAEVTIKSHISALFDCFNATNRLDCIRKAEKLNMVKNNSESL